MAGKPATDDTQRLLDSEYAEAAHDIIIGLRDIIAEVEVQAHTGYRDMTGQALKVLRALHAASNLPVGRLIRRGAEIDAYDETHPRS